MTKQEADQYLKNYVFEQRGYKMRVGEVSDFYLTGEETESEIKDYANDYISHCDSEMAQMQAEGRFTTPDNYPDELDMSLNY